MLWALVWVLFSDTLWTGLTGTSRDPPQACSRKVFPKPRRSPTTSEAEGDFIVAIEGATAWQGSESRSADTRGASQVFAAYKLYETQEPEIVELHTFGRVTKSRDSKSDPITFDEPLLNQPGIGVRQLGRDHGSLCG